MNDDDILGQVRESLSGIHMDTPVEAIMGRAHARRRHQLSAVAAVGAASGVALTVGLFVADQSGRVAPSVGRGGPQLAAFSVTSGPDGASTLTLRKGAQYRLDPDALRQALAQHGIPAVVSVGKMCDSNPEAEGLDQVISSRRLADGSVFTTFSPGALPSGAEISIGYFPTRTEFALIEDGAPLTCTSEPNPGSPSGGSAAGHHSQPVPAGKDASP